MTEFTDIEDPSSSRPVVVIVPCGRSKIWDSHPNHGPARADAAYTGGPFRLNRAYAEHFGDDWIVLSAKHGFVPPEFLIPGPYEVTFKRRSTLPITPEELRKQAGRLDLDRYAVIVVLGGREYRDVVRAALDGSQTRLVSPFAGLPIGKAMQATKRAIATGQPGFDRSEAADPVTPPCDKAKSDA